MSHCIPRILHSEEEFSYIYLVQPNYWEPPVFETLLGIINVLI